MVIVDVIVIAIVSALALPPAFASAVVTLRESLQNEAAADTGVAAGTGDLHPLHRHLLHRRHILARHPRTRLHLHHHRRLRRRQRTVAVVAVVGIVAVARDLADADAADAIGAEMTVVIAETSVAMVEAEL